MIDPIASSTPVAPEQSPGGTYLPTQPPSTDMLPKHDEAFAQRVSEDAQGRASNVNDALFTMQGIVNGDPVAMETFDLGFFEDGTPAIKINGANIPIRHEQWMALLTQRNRTRADIKARMDFEENRRNVKQGINKILAAAPSIPVPLGQMLLTIADMNPEIAAKEASGLLVSMADDGGVKQQSKLADIIQTTGVMSQMAMLDEPVEIPETQNKYGEVVSPAVKTTRAKKRASELASSPDLSSKKTAYAISNISTMFPPKGMKQDPLVNGRSVGVFDMMRMQGLDIGDLSMYDMLRHLAAYSDLWPKKVRWMDPPSYMGNIPGPVDPYSVSQFRKYLMELDDWANKTLMWDRSDASSIDLMIQAIMSGAASMSQQQQAQQVQDAQQPSKQSESTDEITIDLG